MVNLKKSLLVTSALLLGGLSLSSMAAKDGELGNPSIGETIISVQKDHAVMISNVDDINLGLHSAVASDLVGGDSLCVYTSADSYVVTATTASGKFNLLGPTELPFSLLWNGQPLSHGVQSQNFFGDNTSFNCNGSTNVELVASIGAAEFNVAPTGFYSEAVVLMVQPQ